MITARFDFYDEVRVCSNDPTKAGINGELGAVLGKVEATDGTNWCYTVMLFSSNTSCCFFEDELESTGKRYKRDDFFSGDVIRVRVDGHGRGTVVRPDQMDT